ncbi:hypothetical protein VMF7928_01228 [Vibrio marisflavi CECT 7928]|uniref:SURF1-like protein n=2 Tax=Vibrio marisflavi TaxID=1216040 RepID=A0ABM9A1S1_9VIBR|nr:hypothetical protein VMF7928_01228 [Vibrio marisflavi CECT 7928]
MLLKSKNFWVCVLITLVVFSLLVKLGLWQLSRGYEKQQLESHLAQNIAKDPVEFDSFLEAHGEEEHNAAAYTGQKVFAEFSPVSGSYVLLDNQTLNGKVGYLAYQLVKSERGHYFLLERGFVAGKKIRSELPAVNWLEEPANLNGQLYQRMMNPLSNELGLELTEPKRIQNLNLEQLSSVFGVEIVPYLFQPVEENWPYAQPWQPLPMSSKKHFGYSFQWFSMAVMLLVLVSWLLYRTYKNYQIDSRRM